MSSTQIREHILPLTSLRFIAAAMIVALHISGKLGIPDFKESFPYGSGVSFFYVLSCLLYTSPSPRDKRQSRMPSSA